jgi:hypothetical protein
MKTGASLYLPLGGEARILDRLEHADETNPFRALEKLERDLVGAGIKS